MKVMIFYVSVKICVLAIIAFTIAVKSTASGEHKDMHSIPFQKANSIQRRDEFGK